MRKLPIKHNPLGFFLFLCVCLWVSWNSPVWFPWSYFNDVGTCWVFLPSELEMSVPTGEVAASRSTSFTRASCAHHFSPLCSLCHVFLLTPREQGWSLVVNKTKQPLLRTQSSTSNLPTWTCWACWSSRPHLFALAPVTQKRLSPCAHGPVAWTHQLCGRCSAGF